MSIHIMNGIRIAKEKGGYAGNPAAEELWAMPKRELVEIALRLAVEARGEDTPEAAAAAVIEERDVLFANGII